MKRNSIALLCFLSTLGGLFTSASNDPDSVVSISDPNHGSLAPFNDPAGRSLLSQNAEPPAIIVASMDGTISSVDHNSQVVWSLSSGPSLYSVYQALPDSLGLGGGTEPYLNSNNFVDIDDHLNFDIEDLKEKFRMAGKEEDSNTQGRSKDRFITNFSKKSTVFIVDAKSGKLINKYKLDGTPSNLAVHSDVNKSSLSKQYIENLGEATAMDLKKVNLLCITRTNYEVLRFERISGKVLSNMSFAEIKADFVDQGIEHSLSGDPSNLSDEIVSGYKGDLRMLPPQKEVIVVINPDSDPFLSSYQIGRLPERTHKDDFLLQLWAAQQNETTLPVALAPLPMLSGNSNLHHSGWWKNTSILVFLPIFLLLVSVVTWFVSLLKSPELKHTMQVTDSRGRNSARRKKARKLGNDKNSSNTEKNDKNLSSEEAGEGANRFPHIGINGKESWSILTKPVGDGMEGRMVGKLFVSNVEIAKGSNGTVVLEGNYDGRPVAVKRLVQTHHDVAFREIQNLIASDRHPNVVRWYGVEYDSDFVYLSLERCTCSLHDLIRICSESSQNSVLSEDKSMESVNDYNIRLDSVKGIDKNVALWKANGYPSPLLLKIMRDVVSGLAHLHELGIIHRDLKPQNVLIIKERSLCAKLSDMGISKRLQGDTSSLGHHATGYGSSGWQAPEQLLHGRQTRAVDLFSLGCVLFFCITGGRHPFGDRLERDINIVKNRVDLFMVEHIPEAVDLLSHLLDPNPELRIKASNVLDHPLFWSSEMRLSFLRDASDRVELEDRENGSDLLKALENVAPVALGVNWDEKLEVAFINNIGRYRRYKFDSTRDLLRVIRNKLNHYRELPKEIQEILGPVPEGFDAYFASRFPKLLIEVFKVVYKYCEDEECFRKYFKSNSI